MQPRDTSMILGVSGVIGSGKSTFCRLLRDHYGFEWIEADSIVNDLYMHGKAGYNKIRAYLGNTYVGTTHVNRNKLRKLVLQNHQKLWIVNKLIHPLITHEVNKKIKQLKAPYKSDRPLRVCIESFYFEPHDLGKFIDKLIIIDCPDKMAISRLKKRKIPIAEIKKLLKIQRKLLPEGIMSIANVGSKEDMLKSIRI